MTQFTSLRARLVGTVFLALLPAWVLMYFFAYDPPWVRFGAGVLALAAAWYGGERFIMRLVRTLTRVTRLLAGGDLTVRTGLEREQGELGDLARDIDQMASALQQKEQEREASEKILLSKALQQTVVSALGQFALASKDFSALLQQAALMTSQTLEVEYCGIFEFQPNQSALLLRAGVGWQPDLHGTLTTSADPKTLLGHALVSGEPVVIRDFNVLPMGESGRFFQTQGARSGIAIPISAQGNAYGVMIAHTSKPRDFREDEIHFMLAVATVLVMSVARRHTEAELEKLAAFAQLNPNPAMELDANCQVTYMNDAARQLATSLGRQHPRELLPASCPSLVRECLASNRPILNHEIILDRRTLSWSFHPVEAIAVVHVYIQEITERLSLEAQLRESQKMECVGQLAAGVAHDFNNMLTIIQGHSGLLLVKPNLSEEFRDGVQAVYFAAERAAALTRQLLMFSRKNVIQPSPLDLKKVITSTSRLFERLLGESIRMSIQSPENLPLVQADNGMLEQVIMNLVVNARDAMPRGGLLTLSASAETIAPSYMQGHPEARPGEFVRLSVSDTGCGIDAATLPRIFEPFFTTKEVGKGTGLGLATVYGIMKQHDGWIDVESEVGHGTTFSLFFPAHERDEGRRPALSKEPDAIQGGKETILLVEDEFVLRELACSILSDCGYRVIETASGDQALKLWEEQQDSIDLVLTDMVMPEGMSGMELAKRLVASRPGTRIVFASGYSMDDLDVDFLRKGYAGFLQKPYTHVTLSQAVREALDRPAPK